MASVSAVSATNLRTSLSSQQNAAPEDGEPFSLLLNAVADAGTAARRPEAPRVPERRADTPAKAPKPDVDAERQAKRRAPDAETAEAKPQPEPPAPAKVTTANEDGEETESDADGGNAAADALLMIALQEPQQAAVSAPASADADAASVAVAAQAAAVAPAATADMSAAVQPEAQPAQTVQNAAAAKAQFDTAAPMQAEAEAETVLPKISAETLSSLLKPQRTAAPLDAQTQAGSANPATAPALQAPTPLEMLNAAISKHSALSLDAGAGEPQPDAPKPLLSSNAVAPNFAMTAQAGAPVSAQPQQVAETARAVPLEQLAVEIATRASKGERRFDIRLDPPELGRIDVRLEIDHKGNTTTKLIVERAETLDLLQRDARGLEKALQSAGLKTDAGGLEFSLRQDAQTQQGNAASEPRGWSAPVPAESGGMTEVSINSASLAAQLRGGVDIRI